MSPRARVPVEKRFWSRVDKSGDCWLWTGRPRNGYGVLCLGGREGRRVGAHCFAWELVNGAIPPGAQVDHRCLTPLCVNPAHLRLATNKQNQENRSGASVANLTTGVRGVYPHRGKYRAKIKHNRRQIHIGTFDTLAEAAAAVAAARLRLFTHSQEPESVGFRK